MARRRAVLGTAAAAGAAGLAALAASCAPGGDRREVPAVRTGTAETATTVRVLVGQPLRAISPLIYGVASAKQEELSFLRPTLHRWGGNPSSRYNWELGNAWSSARDWEFRNGSFGNDAAEDRQPSGVADSFIRQSRAIGAEPVLTIPALGWVARDASTETRSSGVPGAGAEAGYDPTANRRATSVASHPRKGAPFSDAPDLGDDAVYQDEWVHHLVKRFGGAAGGGVKYYAIDNEPDLWDVTHTDVHPTRPGYDDVLERFLAYATAIKDVDPAAKILGPALSGWTGYLYSSKDRGADNFRTHADRRAHGDQPFLPWWLEQVKKHDDRAGRRTLDVLDVHYYPQGEQVFWGGGGTDAATNALRLRSTRALWDPQYVDESWIKDTVRLIPRLREWIDRYYPGTQLAIGEWNWGAEKTMNGALAVADVLGIFGREGVDLAAYWTSPPAGSPAAHAFRLYTGGGMTGGAFGDQALPVQSGAPEDEVAIYAARDTARGDVALVTINKRSDRQARVSVVVEGSGMGSQARVTTLDGSSPAPRDGGTVALSGRQLSLTLPPSSMTLIRIGR